MLLQAQLFAGDRFVVGIKDLGQVFGGHLFIHRTVVIAGIEGLKIE